MSYKLVRQAFEPLMDIRRFSTIPTVSEETVAEHVMEVSAVAYSIAIETPDADVGRVLEKSLLHDLEEAGTGDIPRWAKRKTETLQDELETVENEYVSGFVESDRIYEQWDTAKDDSIEGQIVASADIISAIMGAHRESQLGNHSIWERGQLDRGIEDAREICDGIPAAERLLDDLIDDLDR